MFLSKKSQHTKINQWLILYVFCNILGALFISTRYYLCQPMPSSMQGIIFSIVQSVGHLGLLCFLITLPIYIISRLFNQKITIAVTVIISCLGLSLLLADTFIYQQYRFHINTMVWELFIAGGGEVISFPLSMWLMFSAITIAFLLIQFFIAKYLFIYVQNNAFKHTKKIVTFIVACLFLSHALHIWADGTFNKDITKQSKYLPLAYPTTAKSLMAKYGLLNVEAHKTQALLKHKNNNNALNYPITPIVTEPHIKKPNIVMIVIDSWRKDMMNKSVTPNIMNFSKKSSNYLNHYSGSNNTRHGMFSLLYGLPGTYWEEMLKQQQGPILIKTLLEQGYQANIFASAKLSMPEFDQTLFIDIPDLRTHSNGELPYQRDQNAVDDYLQWNKNTNSLSPKFSLLFLDAAHGFSLPEYYEKPFIPSLEDVNFLALDDDYDAVPFINLYKNSLHFIDTKIGEVLNSISSELENTVVIITGDHGKEFNDNKLGYWGHNSNYSKYQTAVPLIIYWPNKSIQNITQQTSHLSIVPTLMSNVLGVKNPSKDYSSAEPLSTKTQEWLFLGRTGYYAIQDDKYIYELDRLGNFTIFNENYQEQKEVPINITVIQKALFEMSRFYKKDH